MIENKRELIAQACEHYGVKRLFVFGSVLRADFQMDKSDVDLLVDFHSMDTFSLVDCYFGLREELQRILGVSVDLVMADALKNRYIAAQVEQTRQLLYAA